MMSVLPRLLALAALALAACEPGQDRAPAPYIPLAKAEAVYGSLITAGNHPTSQQHGTGERLGLFRDSDGEIWGFPLVLQNGGAVLVCAPPLVRYAPITDTFPAGWAIVGSSNEPTGWRGGTGNLELLLRDARGTMKWQAVAGAPLTSGPVCQAPQMPGPPQDLHYYRLAPSPAP